MKRFDRAIQRADNLEDAEKAGIVADSDAVRTALVKRMDVGELTLEQVQAELESIKRNAKKNGKVTRHQAWLGHTPDPPCTGCGGTGITYQTERRCACQPIPLTADTMTKDR